MKRTLQVALVFATLAFGYSCSKESANNPKQTSQSKAATDLQELNASEPARVGGKWTFNYDWFCTGTPSVTTLNLKKDATFVTGFGETGLWISGDGLLLFHYDGLNTCYGGRTRHGGVDGIMGEFNSSNNSGCFSLARPTTDKVENIITGLKYPSGKKYDPSTGKYSTQAIPGNIVNHGDDDRNAPGVKGAWTLHYDWNCTGTAFDASITFANDGTFTTGDGYTGQWVDGDGVIIFHFDGINTAYIGKTAGGQVDGIMSTFGGFYPYGCFTMTKGAPVHTTKGAINSAGKK